MLFFIVVTEPRPRLSSVRRAMQPHQSNGGLLLLSLSCIRLLQSGNLPAFHTDDVSGDMPPRVKRRLVRPRAEKLTATAVLLQYIAPTLSSCLPRILVLTYFYRLSSSSTSSSSRKTLGLQEEQIYAPFQSLWHSHLASDPSPLMLIRTRTMSAILSGHIRFLFVRGSPLHRP